MLAPQSNASRTILDFSGVWDFRLKPDARGSPSLFPHPTMTSPLTPNSAVMSVWRGIVAASPCRPCSKVSA